MLIHRIDKVRPALLRDSSKIYYPLKKIFTRDQLLGVTSRYTTDAV